MARLGQRDEGRCEIARSFEWPFLVSQKSNRWGVGGGGSTKALFTLVFTEEKGPRTFHLSSLTIVLSAGDTFAAANLFLYFSTPIETFPELLMAAIYAAACEARQFRKQVQLFPPLFGERVLRNTILYSMGSHPNKFRTLGQSPVRVVGQSVLIFSAMGTTISPISTT